MKEQDWTKFSKRISISKGQNTIFEYFTTQENIEKWFLSKAEFCDSKSNSRNRREQIAKGDKYIWMWHGSDNIAEGEILETNHKNSLKFTFLGCVVSINIKEEEGENVIELVQSDIPLDEVSRMNYYVGCSRGWTFYLTNLKSILEGGLDLRNRNKKLVNVINT